MVKPVQMLVEASSSVAGIPADETLVGAFGPLLPRDKARRQHEELRRYFPRAEHNGYSVAAQSRSGRPAIQDHHGWRARADSCLPLTFTGTLLSRGTR